MDNMEQEALQVFLRLLSRCKKDVPIYVVNGFLPFPEQLLK